MKVNLAQQIFPLIDLTSLNDTDTEVSVTALCEKAVTKFGHVAAVCVYPQFVKCAADVLSGTSVKVATVANFPAGKTDVETVAQVIKQAVEDGAQEIDVVFPYSDYLAGDQQTAFDFIKQVKDVCGDAVLLKVILETGALKDPEKIDEVSRAVLQAGADFLKTSTGKIPLGATPEAAKIMLFAIKEMTPLLNRSFGFKVSGGIRTLAQAAEYIAIANQIMGPDWVTPEHFRFGASQLLDEIML